MNENLRQYYLKQLHVDVWQLRLPAPVTSVPWIIVSEALNTEAEQLLGAMITSIGYQRDNAYMVQPSALSEQMIQRLAPQVILVLGESAEVAINRLLSIRHHDMMIVVSYAISHLLTHGSDKAQAFLDWLAIKKINIKK